MLSDYCMIAKQALREKVNLSGTDIYSDFHAVGLLFSFKQHFNKQYVRTISWAFQTGRPFFCHETSFHESGFLLSRCPLLERLDLFINPQR